MNKEQQIIRKNEKLQIVPSKIGAPDSIKAKAKSARDKRLKNAG